MTELTVQARRDRFLAVLREADAAKAIFSIGDWIYQPPRNDPDDHDCGTVCCAVGLAMLDPTLASAGLGAKIAGTARYGREEILTALEETQHCAAHPWFNFSSDIDAVAEFLGIDTDTAEHCFFGTRYFVGSANVTLPMVISRVETAFDGCPV